MTTDPTPAPADPGATAAPQAASEPPPAPRVALPADDPLRSVLHDEVHARPSPRIRLPALVTYVAVLNEGVTREDECRHLMRLPRHEHLVPADLQGNFLRLRLAGHTLKWERHSEFTRYTIVQALPESAPQARRDPQPLPALAVAAEWLRDAPGRTVAAIELVMVHGDLDDPQATVAHGQSWFGEHTTVASLLGRGHSCAMTDFRLRDSGFERMLVIAPANTSDTRAGRISQRLLELETYRLMALRGLPVAKALAPMLSAAEAALADSTARLEGARGSEQELLDSLIGLAVRIERATAQHMYRFSATQAYDAIVRQRITELREQPIAGTQSIGEFMQHRLSPAIATVAATAQRLASLSQRIERTSALLRTRVDIATATQSQQLLARLTRGQQLQLRLQSTVEGLSIAAISYYVVSLLLYGAKAAKSAGLPLNPELVAGVLIPLVLWVVWRTTRRIHARLYKDE
jgi:uncharacterized membrane-anchored protein